MDLVVKSVQQVAGLMNNISSASQAQSDGIEKINHAIALLDDMTRQNAALVKQAAASAGNKRSHASKVAHAIHLQDA